MITMLVIAIFLSMTSRTIFSPLMPMLQKELGISLSTAGTLFFMISLSYGVTILFAGFLSSRIGHGKAIVTALAAISLGLLLSAVSWGILPLSMGMVLIGAGAGIYPPSGLVMINTTISLEHRSTAFSFHEIGPNLALLVLSSDCPCPGAVVRLAGCSFMSLRGCFPREHGVSPLGSTRQRHGGPAPAQYHRENSQTANHHTGAW